jgi:hypothetical protein
MATGVEKRLPTDIKRPKWFAPSDFYHYQGKQTNNTIRCWQ